MSNNRMIDTMEDMMNGLYKAKVITPSEKLDLVKDLKVLRDKRRKRDKRKG